jgi:hypothetical protein
MQAEVTFSGNTIRKNTVDCQKIFPAINLIKGFRQFIEESDWDERLAGYEKHINRFSSCCIIASVIFLTPVCINIFIR